MCGVILNLFLRWQIVRQVLIQLLVNIGFKCAPNANQLTVHKVTGCEGSAVWAVDGPDNVLHLCVLVMRNHRQLVNSKCNKVSCRERGWGLGVTGTRGGDGLMVVIAAGLSPCVYM